MNLIFFFLFFISIIFSCFISIKLRNSNGYGPYSEPFDLFIFSEQSSTTISNIASTTINPVKLPTKPIIVNSTFNFNNNKFNLKWQLLNNGGSLINKASLIFQIFNLNGILTNKTIESCYNLSNIDL